MCTLFMYSVVFALCLSCVNEDNEHHRRRFEALVSLYCRRPVSLCSFLSWLQETFPILHTSIPLTSLRQQPVKSRFTECSGVHLFFPSRPSLDLEWPSSSRPRASLWNLDFSINSYILTECVKWINGSLGRHVWHIAQTTCSVLFQVQENVKAVCFGVFTDSYTNFLQLWASINKTSPAARFDFISGSLSVFLLTLKMRSLNEWKWGYVEP